MSDTEQTKASRVRAASHPLYKIWLKMRDRCNNPRSDSYPNYGGRGIRVCQAWDCFATFAQDVGPRPSLDHSLDRWPDKNGNYEPGNVRWATNAEQMRNTRRNRYITAFGETKLIVEWLDDPRCAVGQDTLRARIRRGFDLEWSISAPAKTRAENFGAYALAGAENPFSMQRAADERVPHPNSYRKTHKRDTDTAWTRSNSGVG